MNEIYITKDILEAILLKNKVPNDISNGVSIGVTSISDLTEIIEFNRKQQNDITTEACKSCDSHLMLGNINIAELDKDLLAKNLFDEEIWGRFSNSKSNPIQIVRFISLKKPDDTIWWSEDIYEQMKLLYE
jgi:hypothetical protein